MERIKEFDRLYRETEKDWMVVNTMMNCILKPIIFIAMMLPIQLFTWDDSYLFSSMSMLLIIIIVIQMQQYVQIKENGKIVSIYEKLEYIPISKKDIFMARLQYLGKEWRRCMLLALIAQLIGAGFNHKVSIWNFIYIGAYGVILFLIGFCYILPIGYKKKRYHKKKVK